MIQPGVLMQSIYADVAAGKKLHWVLLDPDDFSCEKAATIAAAAEHAGSHGILIGGSLLNTVHFDDFVKAVKAAVSVPVLLFPGDATQLSAHADGLLFLSLVSGRNPVNLIGEQVKGAPVVKQLGLEPLATAYMLVESGSVSSVEFMSNTRPLPRAKPMIAAAHALAAQYMGMDLVYLEGGSGASQSVPADMIRMVKGYIDIPVIVGGGIRTADAAREKCAAGADILVTGNLVSQPGGEQVLHEIAAVVKAAGREDG